MTHAELVERGVAWLRGRKKCKLVFAELVTSAWSVPDVIGWFRATSFLLECKTSRADFFADKKKYASQANRIPGKFRWYMTPPGLVKPEEVPEEWGLLEIRGKRVFTVVEAPKRELTEAQRDEETFILTSAVKRLSSGRSQYIEKTAKFTPWR